MSSIVFVIVILFGVWNTSTQKTANKPLWHDELNELNITCRSSYADIIKYGADAQCSAPPLYYLLSKAFFSIFRVEDDKPFEEILVDSRIFSKISVVLLVSVLLILYRKYETFAKPHLLSNFSVRLKFQSSKCSMYSCS
jgi:hypothetical protein